jgi:hypothetical protein
MKLVVVSGAAGMAADLPPVSVCRGLFTDVRHPRPSLPPDVALRPVRHRPAR